jgi:hypothetical protein
MLRITHRLGKSALIAGASAALVATGTGIALASAPGTAVSSPTTVRLEARGGTSTFVNVRHQRHPAVGDEFILAQPVYSTAHPGQLAGHGYVTVTVVAPPGIAEDHATLVLKQGQIDVAGIQQSSNTFQLAVTGGTGRYHNARGQATVKLLPGPGNKALITLSLLP